MHESIFSTKFSLIREKVVTFRMVKLNLLLSKDNNFFTYKTDAKITENLRNNRKYLRKEESFS